MLIVADGGSSVTDWKVLLPDGQIVSLESKGLNPYYLSEKELFKVLNGIKAFSPFQDLVKEIHFFGAGCTSPDKREMVSNALSAKFPNAFVNVESDLLGTAYATCHNKPGLSCILGTGCNISYFDGEQLEEGVHGLGHVFNEDGSAATFGKRLITDFLYSKMPEDVAKKFEKKYATSKESTLNHLYQQKLPNFFLASHVAFLKENLSDPYCADIVHHALDGFINAQVKAYPQYKELYCHFVGPVAITFKDILLEEAKKNEIHVGKILEKPIEELFDYVRKKEGF